jgi:hypothetical protein
LGVAEEHHSKAAGREIEAVVGEGQLVRVCLLNRKVRDFLDPGALGGDLKQFRTLVQRSHGTLRTYALRQTDSRFASSAGQVENSHAGQRTREFDESFCDRIAQHRRLCLPLFGRD